MPDRIQLPLFPVNERQTPRTRPKPRNPGVATYTKHSPKRRTLCDDCIRDIHERGWLVAPPALTVRWKVTVVGGLFGTGHTDLLCDPHKRARKGE